MREPFRDPGFYGILTEPTVGYERLAAIMVDCRVAVIQLRMKDVPTAEVRETARALRRIIPAGTLFRSLSMDARSLQWIRLHITSAECGSMHRRSGLSWKLSSQI